MVKALTFSIKTLMCLTKKKKIRESRLPLSAALYVLTIPTVLSV